MGNAILSLVSHMIYKPTQFETIINGDDDAIQIIDSIQPDTFIPYSLSSLYRYAQESHNEKMMDSVICAFKRCFIKLVCNDRIPEWIESIRRVHMMRKEASLCDHVHMGTLSISNAIYNDITDEDIICDHGMKHDILYAYEKGWISDSLYVSIINNDITSFKRLLPERQLSYDLVYRGGTREYLGGEQSIMRLIAIFDRLDMYIYVQPFREKKPCDEAALENNAYINALHSDILAHVIESGELLELMHYLTCRDISDRGDNAAFIWRLLAYNIDMRTRCDLLRIAILHNYIEILDKYLNRDNVFDVMILITWNKDTYNILKYKDLYADWFLFMSQISYNKYTQSQEIPIDISPEFYIPYIRATINGPFQFRNKISIIHRLKPYISHNDKPFILRMVQTKKPSKLRDIQRILYR